MKYQIIYADPPWRYEHPAIGSKSRAIENHYPTMILEDIKKLPIKELADDNAVLFMWATAPKLKECIEVLEAWGFEYRTCAVWDKVLVGIGYWFRNQHELLLVGLRGKFSPPEATMRISSIIKERRTEHSKKPDYIRDLIKKWYPDIPKIELFAREECEGWDAWGNEI
jgi:N6-adenosine-specific RNA methylase IME4